MAKHKRYRVPHGSFPQKTLHSEKDTIVARRLRAALGSKTTIKLVESLSLGKYFKILEFPVNYRSVKGVYVSFLKE